MYENYLCGGCAAKFHENMASFTSTLHFLTPSSVFLGLSQKSVNYFYGDMKDAENITVYSSYKRAQ